MNTSGARKLKALHEKYSETIVILRCKTCRDVVSEMPRCGPASATERPWWTPECQQAVRETPNRFTGTQSEGVWRINLDAKNRNGKIIDKAKRMHFREGYQDSGS